jgi:hypothetical protein
MNQDMGLSAECALLKISRVFLESLAEEFPMMGMIHRLTSLMKLLIL